jgi:hypothetical protein
MNVIQNSDGRLELFARGDWESLGMSKASFPF